MNTTYERNLNKAIDLFKNFYGQSISRQDLSAIFFNGKFAENVEEFEFTDSKCAVIMLGHSCMGKSYHATEFIKRHTNFVLCSVDDICLKSIFSSFILSNWSGIPEFGFALDNVLKSKQNVVIDGQFANLVARSALFNTLKEFGYKIFVINFLTVSSDYILKCVEWRSLEFAGAQILHKKYVGLLKNSTSFIPVKDYAKVRRISVSDAIEEIKSSYEFRIEMNYNMNSIRDDILDSNVEFQAMSGAFLCGCDYLLNLDL